MTEIYLIRHGEAEGNVFRRLHGQYDSLLVPRGFTQAKYLENRFKNIHIDAVYSSDLTRACLTARSLYVPKGLSLKKDPRFREVDVGVWEDMPYGYLDNFQAEKMWQFSHDPIAWFVDGSERYETYTGRFITAMTETAMENDNKTIAIFAHGAVIRGTLMHLFFDDKPDGLPLSDNTGVSRLFFENGKFTYDYLNDNSHLPMELSTFYQQAWWRKTDNRKEANLYFVPVNCQLALPEELTMPDTEGTKIAAMLMEKPVGVLCLGDRDGDCGKILGIKLLSSMEGRGYADQILGCAFSFFRKLGCKSLWLTPGDYPDDILQRYEFDPVTGERCIDPKDPRWLGEIVC